MEPTNLGVGRNRKERRFSLFHKPTKFMYVQYDENNHVRMYLHPTKGFKGNKKAIAEFKKSRGQ